MNLCTPCRLASSLVGLSALVFLGLGRLCAADVDVSLTEGWMFTNGAEYPGAEGKLEMGDKSLLLGSNFTNGGQYVAAYRSLNVPNEVKGVTLNASGSGGRFGVALTDATDQTFIYRIGLVGENVQTFPLSLDKPNDVYGGAKDRTLHFPLKAIRLMVEKDAANPVGKMTISKIVLQTQP